MTETALTLSKFRLTLLRGCYLLLAVGLSTQFVPQLFGEIQQLPLTDGVVTAMLSALSLLSILGLFMPLRLLPLLLFEIMWKLFWSLSVALPAWLNSSLDEEIIATLLACVWVLPIVVVVPWRLVFVSYCSDLT